MTKKYYLINEKIRYPEVRLINAEGENIGVVAVAEAQKMAADTQLDLVIVSENAKPPVARILDFKYFLRQEREQAKKSKRKSRQGIKKLHFGPNIGDHDLSIRIKRSKKFLEKGDKVKYTIQFRGRMIIHKDVGREKLEQIKRELAEHMDVEKDIWMEGRQMMLIVRPK